MTGMRCRAVIFDMDGTLLDTLKDLRHALNTGLSEQGLPERSLEEVRRFVGDGFEKLCERGTPNGRQNPAFERVLARARAEYSARGSVYTEAYEGIPALLEALSRAGIAIGVCSNKPDEDVAKLCGHYFGTLVDAAVGARPGVPLKPAPEPLFAVLQKLRVPPEDAVYAGDSQVDLQTAKNAKIRCISVLWGFRDREELSRAGAEVFAETPQELLRLLTP